MSNLLPLRDAYLSAFREHQSVIDSEDYKALEAQRIAIEEKQARMLGSHAEELESTEKALIAALQAENMTELDGVTCKTRKVREVNVGAVLRALGGDIDALVTVASVSQKKLEDWIADNPQMKNELRGCIVEQGVKVVSLLPSA